MVTPSPPSIREALLTLVNDFEEKRKGGNLQEPELLDAAAKLLVPFPGNQDLEQAILTQWQDLFRTGILGRGHSLTTPTGTTCYLTAVGRRTLTNATRDPGNPAGYI